MELGCAEYIQAGAGRNLLRSNAVFLCSLDLNWKLFLSLVSQMQTTVYSFIVEACWVVKLISDCRRETNVSEEASMQH